jgi:hypothetical protein
MAGESRATDADSEYDREVIVCTSSAPTHTDTLVYQVRKQVQLSASDAHSQARQALRATSSASTTSTNTRQPRKEANPLQKEL